MKKYLVTILEQVEHSKVFIATSKEQAETLAWREFQEDGTEFDKQSMQEEIVSIDEYADLNEYEKLQLIAETEIQDRLHIEDETDVFNMRNMTNIFREILENVKEGK